MSKKRTLVAASQEDDDPEPPVMSAPKRRPKVKVAVASLATEHTTDVAVAWQAFMSEQMAWLKTLQEQYVTLTQTKDKELQEKFSQLWTWQETLRKDREALSADESRLRQWEYHLRQWEADLHRRHEQPYEGRAVGHNQGRTENRNERRAVGHNQGHNDGRNERRAVGHNQGRNQGRNEGRNEQRANNLNEAVPGTILWTFSHKPNSPVWPTVQPSSTGQTPPYEPYSPTQPALGSPQYTASPPPVDPQVNFQELSALLDLVTQEKECSPIE